MLGQHGAVLLLECPELGGTFGIGLEIGLDSRANLGRDIQVLVERAMLDVIDILVVELVDIVLHLDDG